MRRMRFGGLIFSCYAALLVTTAVHGQDYPVKPVRMVLTAPGGSIDFTGRLIAYGLPAHLGQPVVMDHRGGSATIPAGIVAKSPADGYTLLLYGTSLWIAPFLQEVSYDTLRDFVPITLAASTPNIIVVHPSLPVSSVRELIALAKSKPGQLSYASAITGSSTHLAGELFTSLAGVKILRVPYRGAGQAITDLIGGQVLMMFANAAGVSPHFKSGRLKPLAVASARPSQLFPDLPTAGSSGLPGYETSSINGLFAPAKTPTAIVRRLHQDTVKVLHAPDVKEQFMNAGSEAVGSSPEEFTAAIKSEMERLGKVIKAAGIRAEP